MEPTDAIRTLGELDIREAIRAEPGAAEGAGLELWLEGLEERRWRELLVELRDIAASVSPRYRDVVDAEDVIGELAVLACDRWLPGYLAELKAGSARASLRAYLKMRLAGHLAEMRRKRKRRAQLLSEHVGPRPILGEADEVEVAQAVLVGGASDPHGDAVVEELVRKAGKDPSVRQILALRYAGFSQDEIAQQLEVSRPTVSRRLAAVATALAVLFGAMIALAWWVGREDGGYEVIAREEALPRAVEPSREQGAPRPAGGGEVERRRGVERWEPGDIDRRELELEREPIEQRPIARADIDGGGFHRPETLEIPSAPDRAPSLARPPLPTPPQARSADAIRSVVAAHRSEVERCFEELAAPRRPARVEATIAIGADGAPTEVRTRGGGDPIDACVASAVRTWRFGPAASATRVTMPFVFRGDEPSDALTTREEEVLECTARGDNACVIRLLEGRARSATELARLIEAYRARGQDNAALRHMRTYVARFPTGPQANAYRQILARDAEPPTGNDIEAHARQCTMSGDNVCVIRLLEGHFRNANQLAMLIEAYRARGQTDAARRRMETFVGDYPTHPRTRTYREVLGRH